MNKAIVKLIIFAAVVGFFALPFFSPRAFFITFVALLAIFQFMQSRLYSYLFPPPPKSPKEIEEERNAAADRERMRKLEYERLLLEKKAQKRERKAAYQKYLNSPKWKRIRAKVMKREDYTCEICGMPAKHVHHKKYPRRTVTGKPHREKHANLMALCARCHMSQHGLS